MKIGLSRNTKMLSFASLLVDVSSEMIIPLLPLFLTKVLLAPVFVVGLMESLDEFVISVSSFLSGLHSDRIGKRKGLILAGYSLSAIAKGLLISASGWPQVVAIRVLERVGKGIREPPRDTLIMLSEKSGSTGRAFGFRKMLDNIGAITGPLLSALMLTFMFANSQTLDAYRVIFMFALVPAVLAVLLLLFVQDKHAAPQNDSQALLNGLASTPNLLPFFAFAAVLALGQFSVMFFILRAADFLPIILVPVAYLAYNVFYTIFSLPAGILADRLGPRATMLLGMLSLLLALAGAAFYPSLIVLFISFAFLGMFMAAVKTVPQVFLSKIVPTGAYASAMGSYRGITGMVGLPANLLAGLLWAVPLLGAPAPFLLSIGTTLAAAVLLLLVVKD